MDKNNNKFNKERNKFNMNQINFQNYPYNKRSKRNFQPIPYDPSQIENINQSEEYSPSPPYNIPNMYQMPIPFQQNKEYFQKNPYKMPHYNLKKAYVQYPMQMQEYLNFPENEMSMEDNALIGNKKHKKKKNIIYMPNIPNNNPIMNNPEMVNNNQTRTNISENNINNNYNENLAIPENYYYYNNEYINNYPHKAGKKKAITAERNRNKSKKGFYKKEKKKFDENYNNVNNMYNINNNENYLQNNNIKPFHNKKNYDNESLSASYLENDNNNFSMEEEEEKEERDNSEQDKDNKNSEDIIILDNSSKEVIDINKIKLVEKKEKSNDETKIKIIPELDKMCSENEIIEREKNKDIDRLEIDANSFPLKKGDKERMVQKYSWRSGKKLNLKDPKEIRNVKAINKSIEYLIEQCLDCDKTKTIKLPNGFEFTLSDIISFIYDRFLAIYETIKLLSDNDKSILNDCDLLSNIGKMIRTLIIFFNLCLDDFDEEKASKEINNYINDLLMPLIDIIKEIIFNEAEYEYNFNLDIKDEFLSYYLLIKIKKERNNFHKFYDEIKSKLNKEQIYKKIDLVNEVYLSLINKDYSKFINILKTEENCDYIFACFMSLFFKEICVYGLQKISITKKELTYKEIKDLLTFEDIEEVRQFLIWYGITKDKNRYIVNESDIVPIVINNPNKKFEYESAPQKTNVKYVEKKKGEKLRKDEVNKKIDFIKNDDYQSQAISEININKDKEKTVFKNQSIIISDISQDKSKQNQEKNLNLNLSNSSSKKKEIIKPVKNDIYIITDTKLNKSEKLDESFMSKGSL